jgi:membrane protein
MTKHLDSNTTVSGERSVAELIHDLSEQLSTLVRDEIRLARAELSEKGKRAGIGAGLFGGAGVVSLYGVGALIFAAGLGLAKVVDGWLAALIVAAALFLIAGILALTGRGQVKQAVPPVPEQAVHSVKTDVETVKERAHR